MSQTFKFITVSMRINFCYQQHKEQPRPQPQKRENTCHQNSFLLHGNNGRKILFKNSLLRVDLTQFWKCTIFFVLQGLYPETTLWCTSFNYVHATCIIAFTSLFIVGKNKCTVLLSSSPCSMFIMCFLNMRYLLSKWMEWMNEWTKSCE